MKLLSVGTNAKTAKSDASGNGYLTAIQYLAPADTVPGLNLCPGSSAGCRASCLFTAGRGIFESVHRARVNRTLMYRDNRPEYFATLESDIREFVGYCGRNGVKPVIRLNGTSDLDFSEVIAKFPDVQFYDYTKVLGRVLHNKLPNYHLTWSRSEENDDATARVLREKLANATVVFDGELPSTWNGAPVLDGDKTDLRFLDAGPGYVVGLKAKGKARKDESGFVVSSDMKG